MVCRSEADGSLTDGAEPAQLLYNELRSRVSQQDFETWFASTPCRFEPPDRFVFSSTNRFRRAWLERNFCDLIRSSVRSLFSMETSLEFDVAPSSMSDDSAHGRQPIVRPIVGDPVNLRCPAPPSVPHVHMPKGSNQNDSSVPCAARKLTRRCLNSEFLFDNFVSGPSNRVALAAALAVCDDPAASYNPLFVYGDAGLGKTHLLHAMCHRWLATTRLQITYLTSEEFVNQFIASLLANDSSSFSASMRDTDILVIDDVQFFSQKERTQDELFSLFNLFLEEGKQVVLSSRSSPRGTSGLQTRLITRFQWGLVARLDPPGFELRVAILLRKARLRHMDLPMDVAEYIANRVPESSREIEGALARVGSLSALRREPIHLEIAREALDEIMKTEDLRGSPTVPDILRILQEHYQVKLKDLLARSKARSIVLPRQMGMFLARELTSLSLEEIGAHFGGRDHTTVLYAYDRIEELRRTSTQVCAELNTLRNRLQRPSPTA